MENKNNQPKAPQKEASIAQKLPYASPQAAFVPLKMEERLSACNRSFKGCHVYGAS